MERQKPTAHRSGLLQWSAYRTLDAFLTAALSRHRLSAPEWKLLGLVYDAGEMRAAEVAEAMDVKAPLVTRNLATLRKKNLIRIEAHGSDKRIKCINVTPAGEKRLEAIESDVRKVLGKLLAGVSPGEAATYRKVLQKIVWNGSAQGKGGKKGGV